MSAEFTLLKYIPLYLIENLSVWEQENCKAEPDELAGTMSQSPSCNVQLGNWTRRPPDHGVAEEITSFEITLTKRIEAIPRDRISDSIYLQHWQGILPLYDQIRHTLDNKWKFVNYLNLNHQIEFFDDDGNYNDPELLDIIEAQKFVTPAKIFTSRPKLVFHDEEWFPGNPRATRTTHEGHVAVSVKMSFGELLFATDYKQEICP